MTNPVPLRIGDIWGRKVAPSGPWEWDTPQSTDPVRIRDLKEGWVRYYQINETLNVSHYMWDQRDTEESFRRWYVFNKTAADRPLHRWEPGATDPTTPSQS